MLSFPVWELFISPGTGYLHKKIPLSHAINNCWDKSNLYQLLRCHPAWYLLYIPTHAYHHTRALLTEYPLRLTYYNPYWLLSTPFTVTFANLFKIRFANEICSLLNHFLTDCAVNAQSVNSNPYGSPSACPRKSIPASSYCCVSTIRSSLKSRYLTVLTLPQRFNRTLPHQSVCVKSFFIPYSFGT